MQLTLSIAIMQLPISVAIMHVWRLYCDYVGVTFRYNYVGASFGAIMQVTVPDAIMQLKFLQQICG